MGNSLCVYDQLSNPFYAPNQQDSSTAQILSQFKMVSAYEDELFLKCSVIENKSTNELIVAKQIGCKDEGQMHRLYSDFERRQQTLTNEHLIRLRYVLKSRTDGLFSDEFRILLFFDYIITSSLAEYNNRQKKKLPFSADEINTIMIGAIRGYAALEEKKVANDKVRLRNIYFGIKDKSPITKIVDSKLFPTENNLTVVRNRSGQRDDVFLSPEELKGNITEKSGVFSLGVSMIQLCLLQPCRDTYNYSNNSLNYKELETRLDIIKGKYPISIYYLIREMLERNHDIRPSFKKLATSLPTNFRNMSTNLNLSVVGKSTQHINKQSSAMKSKFMPPVGNSKTLFQEQRGVPMNQTLLISQYRPKVNTSEVYRNGNMYTGQKKDNLRHGKGKYLHYDGSYYYGDWFKGKMDGNGKFYDRDGNLEYEGQWKNDRYQGRGVLYGLSSCDWVKYEGEFTNGKMEGFGEMIFKDGSRYKGQFKNDLIWGKGRMFDRNGQVINAIWERGRLLTKL